MDQAFNIDRRTNHGILPCFIMICCEYIYIYLIIRGGGGGIGFIMGSVGPGLCSGAEVWNSRTMAFKALNPEP